MPLLPPHPVRPAMLPAIGNNVNSPVRPKRRILRVPRNGTIMSANASPPDARRNAAVVEGLAVWMVNCTWPPAELAGKLEGLKDAVAPGGSPATLKLTGEENAPETEVTPKLKVTELPGITVCDAPVPPSVKSGEFTVTTDFTYDVEHWRSLQRRADVQRRFGIRVHELCLSTLSSLAPGLNCELLSGAFFIRMKRVLLPRISFLHCESSALRAASRFSKTLRRKH
jgi:hypothetical protein